MDLLDRPAPRQINLQQMRPRTELTEAEDPLRGGERPANRQRRHAAVIVGSTEQNLGSWHGIAVAVYDNAPQFVLAPVQHERDIKLF